VIALSARRRARGLFGPSALALAAIAVLIGLGVWQLERKAWKEGLTETLEQRLSADATGLPPADTWRDLDPDKNEFRRVRFSAEFQHDQEALAFTAGSTLRADAPGPGYWVFTPARLSDGSVVVVNRGLVPEGRQNPAARAEGQVSGRREIEGVMRWPETRSVFTPADDPQRNLWFVRDHQAMAAAKGWRMVAPFYVEQEAPPSPGGLPSVGKVRPNLPNNHLQYAFTWFALAGALAAIFGIWLRARRHENAAA